MKRDRSPVRLGVFVTHPIQYQVPLWRELATSPHLDLTVHYFSDQGVAQKIDPGFGKAFTWDVPLLDGYRHRFLSRRPIEKAAWFRIAGPDSFFTESRFDVVLVHGYTHWFTLQLLAGAKQYGFKVILRGEFSERRAGRPFWKRMCRDAYLRWLYQRVHHFCPIGTEAIRHLERYGIPQEKMTVTPYSVDDRLLARQRAQFDRIECRKRLGIGDDQVVFLFSGKMIERKQPLLLSQAALRLKRDSRLAVIFLGDGEQFVAVCNLLRPALGERFIAPGFVNQSELGRYFCAADVFVLPSRFDTWGLVVNEAMHFGLPCIVSDRVGSCRDLIIPNETGLVFPSGDAGRLAEAMQFFLDEPKRARIMGEAASRHIEGYTTERAAAGIREAVFNVTGACRVGSLGQSVA